MQRQRHPSLHQLPPSRASPVPAFPLPASSLLRQRVPVTAADDPPAPRSSARSRPEWIARIALEGRSWVCALADIYTLRDVVGRGLAWRHRPACVWWICSYSSGMGRGGRSSMAAPHPSRLIPPGCSSKVVGPRQRELLVIVFCMLCHRACQGMGRGVSATAGPARVRGGCWLWLGISSLSILSAHTLPTACLHGHSSATPPPPPLQTLEGSLSPLLCPSFCPSTLPSHRCVMA